MMWDSATSGSDSLPRPSAAARPSASSSRRSYPSARRARPLYILDEPTTGLSFEDCAYLLRVLHRLVDAGNTVVLIEHHLDLIKSADWLIDLGPGAGDRGGEVVAVGAPRDLADMDHSETGRYLKRVFADAKQPQQAEVAG